MPLNLHRCLPPCARLLALALSALAAPAVLAQPAEDRVTVNSFTVTGNSLLPAATVDDTLANFKGPRTLAELKLAAAALQERYREAGYGAVVVFLPPQTEAPGSVKLVVVEGRLQEITVSGQAQFSEANIRASLPALGTGTTPLVRRIDTQIQMANENPAKRVQVLLQPGRNPGDVDAKVSVVEQPVLSGYVRIDNTGNDRTGDVRAALGGQHANVSGRDDVLSAELQTAPENPSKVAVLSTAYHLPLYERGLAVDGFIAISDIDGGSSTTAAGALQFNGRGQVLGLRVTDYLPRQGEIDQRLSYGLEYRNYLNNCQIAGLPAGACGPAGASVAVSPMSLSYAAQTGGPLPFGLNAALSHNLGLGGRASAEKVDAVRPGADDDYTVLRIGGFGVLPLPQDWSLRGQMALQWADEGLVPGEQFGLGGANSVRGFEERELNGDIGATLSVELITPDLAKLAALESVSLRALAFFDAGWVKNRLDTACLDTQTECTARAFGLGFRLTSGPWSLQLDLAQALTAAASTQRDDLHAHFSLSYRF